MDIQEKDDGLKIKIPIITNQELEELDNNILNNYQTIYGKISKVVAKDRDIIILKRIIEYQHNELDKKDKIIDKLLTEITAVNSGRYEYMDNDEVLEIFTKKAEGN